MKRDKTGPEPFSRLRAIPSVERILSSAEGLAASERFGRAALKRAVNGALESIRIGSGEIPSPAGVLDSATLTLEQQADLSLRRVVNATGVIIHTNLGRAPVSEEITRAAAQLISSYSNLEYDLDQGTRGSRNDHLSVICRELFGSEAALLTNNNAAATLLAMAAIGGGREVIVSRGELVEIGGSFRVPEIIQQGGARLREVGTTNRTRIADYADAIGERSAAILRVHRSNFEIVGFTEDVKIEELIALSRKKNVPFLYDEGSGRVVDLEQYGFERQKTLRELIASGVDVITCSTDKLIGATQGGLILGRADLVERCARHPLMRALRAGKESVAIIAATLRSFVREKHESEIAIYRMLHIERDVLEARATALATRLGGAVREVRAALGGGTTPAETIFSFAVAIPGHANDRQRSLLRAAVPIVGRIENDELLLDVRTLLEGDEDRIASALAQRASNSVQE